MVSPMERHPGRQFITNDLLYVAGFFQTWVPPVMISYATHLDLLHSESRYSHTRSVSIGEEFSVRANIMSPLKHKALEQLFFNRTRQYFSPCGASERLSGEDSPG